MKIIAALGGRKFLLAVLAAITIPLSTKYGIDPNTIMTVGAVLIAAILGQSVADAASGGATASNAPDPIEQGRIEITLGEQDVKVAAHAADQAKHETVTAAIESGKLTADHVAAAVQSLT